MTERTELREDRLRDLVTAAAGRVLDNAGTHVEHYWRNRDRGGKSGFRGDHAEATGLGFDIFPEIYAMAQEIWSYAQHHVASIADNLTADAIFAAILIIFPKPKPPIGSALSSDERQAVAEELARRVADILAKEARPGSTSSAR